MSFGATPMIPSHRGRTQPECPSDHRTDAERGREWSQAYTGWHDRSACLIGAVS